MSLFSPPSRNVTGYLLVLLQFGLLAGLAVLALPAVWQNQAGPLGGLLLAFSGGLGAWTLWHNRLGNFNVHPEPKASGVLITTGPYRLMRHPMYTTVLLAAAAMASVPGNGLAWGLWLALAATLLAKAKLEEQWLREHHPQYARYCQQCKRFIPWVF